MKQALRQTRSHIADVLARRGLTPRHDLGQNFLIDLNLLEFLVTQAELTPDDVILEVGSGTGGLTSFLSQTAAHVVAVEVDSRMRELTAEAVAGSTNVTLVGCDVLKNKNQFSEPVIEALEAALGSDSRPLKLVANLPYCVATPVISNLVASRYPWTRMVVTIQLELAQRMAARERTADYSALSAWLQAQCRLEILKRLPPDVFWPRPNVESAMILIEPDPVLRNGIHDREFLHRFLRDVFTQRRKVLRKVLTTLYGKRVGKDRIDELLKSQELGPHARAEELPPPALVRLANALSSLVSHESNLPGGADTGSVPNG